MGEEQTQGELATEKSERENSDQEIRDDISGVDVRVDDLENTVVKRCLVDSDCGGALDLCIDGWCSIRECVRDQDCDTNHEYCDDGLCQSFSGYDYRPNTYITGI